MLRQDLAAVAPRPAIHLRGLEGKAQIRNIEPGGDTRLRSDGEVGAAGKALDGSYLEERRREAFIATSRIPYPGAPAMGTQGSGPLSPRPSLEQTHVHRGPILGGNSNPEDEIHPT